MDYISSTIYVDSKTGYEFSYLDSRCSAWYAFLTADKSIRKPLSFYQEFFFYAYGGDK